MAMDLRYPETPFTATTREYATGTGTGYCAAVASGATTFAIAGNLPLGPSREVRVRASAACWLRFATAATGQAAAAASSNAAATSMPIDANQAEVIRVPAAATHISVIRDSADGTITFTPVV